MIKTSASAKAVAPPLRHALFARCLPDIIETIEAAGYDTSSIALIGEGAESSALAILDPAGEPCVLKISSPLIGGWEPDWGNREFDALISEIDGTSVQESDCGCFWFVQEYAQTYARAEYIPDYLWEEFEALVGRFAQNLFLDDTGLVKQIGVVERNGEEKLVVFDYAAFSAHDNNLPSFSY